MATLEAMNEEALNVSVEPDFQFFDDEEESHSNTYSQHELLEIIHEIATLSHKDFLIVQQKMTTPGISLSEIGKRLELSKQAVAKRINVIIKTNPCFEKILKNKRPGGQPHKNHRRKDEQALSTVE